MCSNCEQQDTFGEFLESNFSGEIPQSHLSSRSSNPSPDKTHKCLECRGTGTWVSPRGKKTGKCFNCGGKGYFMSSYKDRMKAKQKRIAKKEEVREQFDSQNPDLINALQPMVGWNSFAKSLVEQYLAKGFLSEKQVSAAQRMIVKVKQQAEERQKKKITTTVDAAKIQEIFQAAEENGLKRPVFRAGKFQISKAPATGRNPGALYVKINNTYVGKVQNGNFYSAASVTDEMAEEFEEITKDPKKAAVKYGKETGICSCCGRQLTDPKSVAQGIGPVCILKWGL